MGKLSILVLLVAIAIGSFITYNHLNPTTPPDFPKDGWWGKGDKQPDSEKIDTFEVQIPSTLIRDMMYRLERTRFFDPLEDANFQYGFNANYMRGIVKYWFEEYKWVQHQDTLNSYKHYRTQIEGIKVHYIRVPPMQPEDGSETVLTLPILMIHGWPGSFYEFYKTIPYLINPDKYGGRENLAFEVICPSIPGYGFSDPPEKKGFDFVAAARVFNKLMKRLGHEQYYVQGGDWGSIIGTTLSQLYPESVKGVHLNMFPVRTTASMAKLFIGSFVPSLVMSPSDAEKIYPYMENLKNKILKEMGYYLLQSTKPDTVGMALINSPAGLAAYILEKFSTWTNNTYRDLPDGGLERHFSLDELLTNVMIYWVSGSMPSAMRFYKESMSSEYLEPLQSMPVTVPSSLAAFPNEFWSANPPKSIAASRFVNIYQYSEMPRGGHFAAFEEPVLIASDVKNFVRKVESRAKKGL